MSFVDEVINQGRTGIFTNIAIIGGTDEITDIGNGYNI